MLVVEQRAYWPWWGKTDREEGFHLFALHCLDVAAVAERWLKLAPGVARALDAERLLPWLLFYAAAHDLGKLAFPFQSKNPAVLRLLQGIEPVPSANYRHDLAGLQEFVNEYGNLHPNHHAWMAAAAAHHGARMPMPSAKPRRKRLIRTGEASAAARARAEWLADLEALFLAPEGLSLAAVPPPPPAAFEGFCSVVDWVGSAEHWFPYVQAPQDLRAYFEARRVQAAQALRGAGLLGVPPARGGMSLYDFTPRQIQCVVDELPVAAGLLMLESSTGSGKTEAALAYAARLLLDGQADGIIFALPTQATANAMYARLVDDAARLFPDETTQLVLAHGKARFNPAFQAARTSAQPDDAAITCAPWLVAGKKRSLLGRIGVCTIDQVLLGALPVRHASVRRFAAQRHVLIVDEVHAYDAYMNRLLETVLEQQRAAGGSAILLSATLPQFVRRRLAAAWAGGVPALAAEPDYPLATHATGAEGVQEYHLRDEDKGGRVTIELAAYRTHCAQLSEGVVEEVIEAVYAGAQVCVIANTVREAQAFAEQLEEAGLAPLLFHSRFSLRDRNRIEAAVIERFGKHSRRTAGQVLVATQVVEQSLDLDFDFMVTQICPVDLLFQRLGRLHRHADRHGRPEGYETPRCLVVGASERDYGATQYVYRNLPALWRTQKLIESYGQAELPADYRPWIETVYACDPWSASAPATDEPGWIQAAETEWVESLRASDAKAKTLSRQALDEALSDEDERIVAQTREGELGCLLVPTLQEGTLVTGESPDALPPALRLERLQMEAIPVHAKYRSTLPPAEEGLHMIPVAGDAEAWVSADGRFTYQSNTGLSEVSQ